MGSISRHPRCGSAVSSASCKRMREAASKFGVGSTGGVADMVVRKARTVSSSEAQAPHAADVLLQFVAAVVGQFVVNVQT